VTDADLTGADQTGADLTGAGRWRRPVPLVGDPTSAAERAVAPGAWAFPEGARAALDDVISARRDIRRFRPDPVPDDLLTSVLRAGHAAPSVGHCQPWRFVVVTGPRTRERAAVLADRERLRQAAQLDADRARHLLDLQLEGIREAPVGIVVACDRRAPAAGVLGRATFPDADLWSCACAIQNLWLTARAHGLGLGWVTLFRPADLAELVGLPEGVETLGWLCLGWPDERPPEPGLQRHGWSHRLPLADVVLRERWPADGVPPAPPVSCLRAPGPQTAPDPLPASGALRAPDPLSTSGDLRAPGPDRVVAAANEAEGLLTPPGSLGLLDLVLQRVVAAGGAQLRSGTLVLAGADHPVAGLGVTAYPPGTTREVMLAAVAGEALGVVSARTAGLAVTVVDAGVDGGPVPGARVLRPAAGRGDLLNADALAGADLTALLDGGRALGREAAAAGLVVLGEVGLGNTTVAAAMCCALLGTDPGEVVGLGAGADSAMLQRKADVVTGALERLRGKGSAGESGSGATDPREVLRVLQFLGGPELAVLTGVVLGAAEAGTCIVLDGFATGVAALVAARIEPAVTAYLVAGQRSRERAHLQVLTELGLEPLLDLRLRAGEGTGGCLAAGLLLHALAVRRDTGRVAERPPSPAG
jgi:nicotinate-nucleotide--dimethylbenzimidazole phosphoribosyltransferase